MPCRKSVFHFFLLWRICGFVLYIKHLHLVCFIAKIWTIEYSIEIFNVLVFVVLVNPIAGNGVVLEKFYFYCKRIRDFPGGSDVKRLLTMWGTWVQSLGLEDLLEKEMATHSSILAWKSHGRRSLEGYSPWCCKESDTTEWIHFHFLLLLVFERMRNIFSASLIGSHTFFSNL